MTLVEKAMKHGNKPKQPIGAETKELALSWLKGEITTAQVSVALTGKNNDSCKAYHMALAIRELYKEGNIIIK
jgi:hypothetical protein